MQHTSIMNTLPPQQITTDVLLEKYAKGEETTQDEIFQRVARHLASVEKTPELQKNWYAMFYENMKNGAIGAGRIMSASGTDLKATLLNCYVVAVGDSIDGHDEDQVPGIYEALRQSACTMQKGGGVGYNFSKIRPKGAWVKSVNSEASGPCSYIDIFDKSCQTIESAGSRRGAQIGALNIDHPDIFDFISAKRTPGRWNNFNVSVVVTDKFMHAKNNGEMWDLVHKATPSKKQIEAGAYKREDGTWVYRSINATELWDAIMRSNYDFAEPGILFYDNINKDNNLWYTEKLEVTNPCVTGDTKLLTPSGYVRIDMFVDSEVTIWNGFEWSKVTPRITGVNQEILDLVFSDGTELSCTPYHKFVLSSGERVEAEDLTQEDRLARFDLPVVDGCIKLDVNQAYDQGFYSYETTEQVPNKVENPKARLLTRSEDKNFVPGTEYALSSRLAWLSGAIDAGGIVSDNSVSLCSNDKEFLVNIKLMLAATGCFSSLVKGFSYKQDSIDVYRLTIDANSIQVLKSFGLCTKLGKLDDIVALDQLRTITLVSATKRDQLANNVYCFTDPLNNTGLFNGIMTGNCGEVPLPANGCCDLGPIILPKLVRNPFKPNATFDFTLLKQMVGVQVRMLDNVLDASVWPLPQQKKEAMAKRRIGVGFTGLANALAMLGLVYYNEEGLKMAERICETMRNAAYAASAMIAVEKGSFPLFNLESVLAEGTAASRLPDSIKTLIATYGLRNSHLLSIAPTGTVSLAFADNASNGIEPPYSLAYTRKKRTGDGHVTYNVLDHSLRVWLSGLSDQGLAKALETAICNYQEKFTYNNVATSVREHLPLCFVTALQMTTDQHLAMMRVVQPYICQSISKTVNVPKDSSFEEFKTIYDNAWKFKLKGVSTYRPNDILGSVLSVEAPKQEEQPAKVDVKEIVSTLYNTPFESRSDGMLHGTTVKGRFHTEHGEQKFILTINFVDVTEHVPGHGEVSITRPIEFLLVSNFTASGSVWQAAMRFMSLMARQGVPVPKIIENMKEVTWEHGKVRYGYRLKDGKKVPLWHNSDVAAIGHAIEETLVKLGYLDEDGKVKHSRLETLVGESPVSNKASIVEEPTEKPIEERSAKSCPECGAKAMVKRDGCEACTSCGHIGSCG